MSQREQLMPSVASARATEEQRAAKKAKADAAKQLIQKQLGDLQQALSQPMAMLEQLPTVLQTVVDSSAGPDGKVRDERQLNAGLEWLRTMADKSQFAGAPRVPVGAPVRHPLLKLLEDQGVPVPEVLQINKGLESVSINVSKAAKEFHSLATTLRGWNNSVNQRKNQVESSKILTPSEDDPTGPPQNLAFFIEQFLLWTDDVRRSCESAIKCVSTITQHIQPIIEGNSLANLGALIAAEETSHESSAESAAEPSSTEQSSVEPTASDVSTGPSTT